MRIRARSQEGGAFFLPIIASRAARVLPQKDAILTGGLRVRAEGARLPDGEAARQYSQVGGFECVRVEIPLAPGEARTVEITLAENPEP